MGAWMILLLDKNQSWVLCLGSHKIVFGYQCGTAYNINNVCWYAGNYFGFLLILAIAATLRQWCTVQGEVAADVGWLCKMTVNSKRPPILLLGRMR